MSSSNPTLPASELYQIENPYYSTIAFEKFLNTNHCFKKGTEILDVGTGLGANLHYFRSKHPEVGFLGIDYNEERIEGGKHLLEHKGLQGVELAVGDWMNLPKAYQGRFHGIFSVHSLCVFKRIETPIEKLCELSAEWIAFNSLFYEGNLDVLIHIRDHDHPEYHDDWVDSDFNIFSLDRTAEVFRKFGYTIQFQPFFPPVALPKKPKGARGTYTMQTELSPFSQFSGPVHLPWYFVLATKIGH